MPGNESVEADAFGNVLRYLGRKEPVRGNDLYLSLDYGLQTIATEQLAGRRGAIVAIDPRTGEILALVSSQVLTLIYLSLGLVAKIIQVFVTV